jgi:hypothetical protein
MGGLLLIVPIVAFDFWLAWTTGRRQISKWRARKAWGPMAAMVAAGLLLATGLTFFLRYHFGPDQVQGFPIPWAHTSLPPAMTVLGAATDFLTGLAAPFIPFKVAEFLSEVKAELK